MMEKPKLKPEHRLMEAIGFTEDDLDANAQGRISDRQRESLTLKRRDWLILRNTVAGLVILATIFVALFLSRENWFIWLSIWAVPVVGFFYTLRQLKRRDTDLSLGQAHVAEGRVSLLAAGDNQYSVTVDEVKLSITSPVFYAFKNGDPYRIYYTPNTRTILSAEWLREE